MTEDQLRTLLKMTTIYSPTYLDGLDLEALEKLYKEKCE